LTKIDGGYYIKARCIQESEIQHAPPHVREIWDWFIMQANHTPYKKYGNNFERGQLLCTYANIQEALHWTIGWRKKTYSKSDCETAMKWLKKRTMVATRKTTKGMIVTICNYSRFQDPKNYETYTEAPTKATREPQTDDSINKNEKNNKKEKNKDIYGEFKNVKLSEDEHKKLSDKFNGTLNDKIETLSGYKKSKGVTYKDDYATILNWARKEEKDKPSMSKLKEKDYSEGVNEDGSF
jgi:hypothetical protein